MGYGPCPPSGANLTGVGLFRPLTERIMRAAETALFQNPVKTLPKINTIFTLFPEYSIIPYVSSFIPLVACTSDYATGRMPRRSRLQLPPVLEGDETIGKRLARIRKEQGYTQVELAERIGIIQALVSDYERDKLRLNAEMLIRFAQALNVSADDILGISAAKRKSMNSPSLKILRRLNRISSLPPAKQKAFLQTIDALLKVQEG